MGHADLLLRRKLPTRHAPDLLDDLLCRFLFRPGFLSHLRSLNGYDGPQIPPSSTCQICLIGADAGQPGFGGKEYPWRRKYSRAWLGACGASIREGEESEDLLRPAKTL